MMWLLFLLDSKPMAIRLDAGGVPNEHKYARELIALIRAEREALGHPARARPNPGQE